MSGKQHRTHSGHAADKTRTQPGQTISPVNVVRGTIRAKQLRENVVGIRTLHARRPTSWLFLNKGGFEMLRNSLTIVLCGCFVFAGLGMIANNANSSSTAVAQQTPTPSPSPTVSPTVTPAPTPCFPDDPRKPCPSPSPTAEPMPTTSPTMQP